jgi:polyisoprenoid-binding protein YceI
MSNKEAGGTPVTPTNAAGADRTEVRAPGGVGRYGIDDAQTRVEVRLRYAGIPLTRVAGRAAGTIEVPTDLTSVNIAVRVDVGDLTSIGGHHAARPGHDVEPAAAAVATFEASRMEPILESYVTHDGDRPLWALVGDLTLGGVMRPARIAVGVVRTVDDGDAVVFSGSATLRCSDFGIRRPGRLLSNTFHLRITGMAYRDEV